MSSIGFKICSQLETEFVSELCAGKTRIARRGDCVSSAASRGEPLARLRCLREHGDETRDSVYPVQLRSATDEFRVWVKRRFLCPDFPSAGDSGRRMRAYGDGRVPSTSARRDVRGLEGSADLVSALCGAWIRSELANPSRAISKDLPEQVFQYGVVGPNRRNFRQAGFQAFTRWCNPRSDQNCLSARCPWAFPVSDLAPF